MTQKIGRAYFLLSKAYGIPKRRQYNPIETLVETILSQNTNDINSGRAYASLVRAFPNWESVSNAPIPKIEKAIKSSGLYVEKARRIKRALEKIKRDNGGRISLGFLKPLSLDQAREYLLSFDGIGPKTAAVILCFSLNKPAFPVDTHIFRVSKRLGLIPEKTTVEKAHAILEKKIPPERAYPIHLLLIHHGRKVCHSRKPECPTCILRKSCPYKFKTKP